MNPSPISSQLPTWLKSALWTALAAGTGTAVLILLMVLFHELHLTGSAADWLATLCNIVMAGSAVAAFIIARSWLPQLTTQEGYRLAIRMVNDHILQLDYGNSFLRHAQWAAEEYHDATTEKKIEKASELYDVAKQALSTQKSILNLKKQMATYGLHAAPSRSVYFDGMMNDLDTFIGSVISEAVLLKYCIPGTQDSLHLEKYDEYGLIDRLKQGEKREDLLRERQKITSKTWRRMTDNQKAFLGTDSRIGNLFVVKK